MSEPKGKRPEVAIAEFVDQLIANGWPRETLRQILVGKAVLISMDELKPSEFMEETAVTMIQVRRELTRQKMEMDALTMAYGRSAPPEEKPS